MEETRKRQKGNETGKRGDKRKQGEERGNRKAEATSQRRTEIGLRENKKSTKKQQTDRKLIMRK